VQASFQLTIVDAATKRTVHDSGIQVSAQPSYELPAPLPSGREYEWSVVWRDAAGRASPPSEPAAFRTAISDPSWTDVPWLGSNTTNVYRTEVSVAAVADDTLAAATLYICALGYGKVSVNGKPVTDEGLLTISGWTSNERMNYFETYDLTAHMREASLTHGGAMALGVSLGHGWRDQSRFPRKDPKEHAAGGDEIDKVFRAILTTTSVDGTVTTLTSTAAPTWSAAAGPVTADGTYDGETYDARMEMPGWDIAGFAEDAAAWSPAPTVADGPRGKMVASSMPAVGLDRVVKPIGITNPAPGVFVVDYGTNVAGWSVIKNMKGKAGQTVMLKHAEIMQHENLPGNQGTWRKPIAKMNSSLIYQGNLRSALATDTYIMKGDAGGETYHPSFTYHGCRFVEVTGLESLTVDDIEYHHFHTANAPKAKTTFSSPSITAIQKLAVGAQRSNMMTVPTDCDQRDERLGWMGDADLSAEAMLINYDCGPFLQMFMKNMESEIDPDGSLTDVVPFVRYGNRPGDPSWTAAFIEVAYQLFKQEGKDNIPKMYWDKIQLHLSKFAEMAKKDASKWPPTEYGDWVPPPYPKGLKISGGPKPDREMTSAHAWIGNIQSVIEMADAIGEKATATSLKATLGKLSAQFNDEWLHPNGTYGNNVQSTYSLPLSLDIVPESAKKEVEANMVKNVDDKLPVPEGCGHWPGHITTGIIGGKYLFQALADAGHKDVALKVLETTDYPGFGFMFSNTMEPATENLWELFDAPYEGVGMNSRNHHMVRDSPTQSRTHSDDNLSHSCSDSGLPILFRRVF
jgi:alpha-L-rhamnosidase